MTPTAPGTIGKPGRTQRRSISLSNDELVSARAPAGPSAPLEITPAVADVDVAEWAGAHRERIDGWLLEHRALLFRGFAVESVAAFHAFVAASSSGNLLQYKDRSTPRYEVGAGVYVSTIYPADQRIQPHNEGTYWLAWPRKIYFACQVAPRRGGETPICDVRRVYDRIDPAVRERFESSRVLYVRNYNQGVGLTWQEAYQTAERAEVEAYCRANRIEYSWQAGDRLRTRQIRPAVRRHPETGEKLWFNHGAFFHISSQEPSVRRELLAAFAVEDLPFNTYYGDGAPIEDDVAAHLREAYSRETVAFPWQPGDILLLDNMTMAHSREPYEGDRKIVVAMVDAETGEA